MRVLVVDDDFRVASIHRAYTEQVPGFTVVGECHTGAAALKLNVEERPDVVLLDIYLPDLHGLEVARRLREDGPVDIIVITAATDVDIVRGAAQCGALDYLVKPFTFPVFRSKLEHYRQWRATLSGMAQADQQTIDGLFGLAPARPASRVPKGLSEATLVLIEGVLRDSPSDLTAVEVAGTAGVSRVTARRYLDYLVAVGRVELTLKYGVVGRPEHHYRFIRGSPG